jgi:serine protease Do
MIEQRQEFSEPLVADDGATPAPIVGPSSPPAAPPPSAGGHYGPVLLLVLLIAIALFLAPYAAQEIAYSITRGQEMARAEVARNELIKLPNDGNRLPLVARIIEPSVVSIRTTVRSQGGGFAMLQPQAHAGPEGSGVIVDPAGYIVTNAHVVSAAAAGGVAVQLSDGRTIQHATIVGTDPAVDLAVLKIDAGGLSAAHWGDSDALQVGDSVLAVGSPYGLAATVTAGIISAKNRSLDIKNVRHEDFLQTDAAVNPGNSGGPLVNMKAEVVGINTAIVGTAYQGIGFSIPSKLARQVYDMLKTTTGVQRGWIGVAVQDVTGPLAEQLGLKEARGALISEVLPDSPAQAAGLSAGDVIVQWDRHAVSNSTDLRVRAAQTKPGSQATIIFYRDGRRQQLAVTVGTRPNQVTQ